MLTVLSLFWKVNSDINSISLLNSSMIVFAEASVLTQSWNSFEESSGAFILSSVVLFGNVVWKSL